MAILTSVAPIESQLWPQGDIRDPLGVWGARLGVTGDASGNPITVNFRVPAEKRSAYVYTIYHAIVAVLAGGVNSPVKIRILTNWPNIDPDAGVQGYSTLGIGGTIQSTAFTSPIGGPGPIAAVPQDYPYITPLDRFILCFDPRQQATLGAMDILSLEKEINTNNGTYSFEAYGYFWDRSVMQAPGGPRHPGAS